MSEWVLYGLVFTAFCVLVGTFIVWGKEGDE